MQKEITAGDILKRARLRNSLSLQDVEKKTFISPNTLSALENNTFGFFQSRINAELLSKKYAKFLGENEETVASLVRRDFMEDSALKLPYSNLYANSQVPLLDLWWKLGMVPVISAVIFFTYQVYLFVLPPKISIFEPKDVAFKRVEKIFVKGVVDMESQVSVNGKRSSIDLEGVFVSEVPLRKGENIIKVEVLGANGRKIVKEITVTNN